MASARAIGAHYDAIPQTSVRQRTKSEIFKLRAFNNWIKSVLIDVAIEQLMRTVGSRANMRVMDVACGKGGDIGKWHKAGVAHVSMVDVAGVSVEQARERYYDARARDMRSRGRAARDDYFQYNEATMFTADFHCANMCTDDLIGCCAAPAHSFDLVACQFAVHYAFDAEAHAQHVFAAIARALKKGGVFIGTTLNAERIVALLRAHDGSWSNGICTIGTDDPMLKSETATPPLFGAQYEFTLGDQVVKCPECLVDRRLLAALGAAHGLQLSMCTPFADFFVEQFADAKYRRLIDTMNALDGYPKVSDEGDVAADDDDGEWEAARRAHEKLGTPIGTLRRSEAEVADLYIAFMFTKL